LRYFSSGARIAPRDSSVSASAYAWARRGRPVRPVRVAVLDAKVEEGCGASSLVVVACLFRLLAACAGNLRHRVPPSSCGSAPRRVLCGRALFGASAFPFVLQRLSELSGGECCLRCRLPLVVQRRIAFSAGKLCLRLKLRRDGHAGRQEARMTLTTASEARGRRQAYLGAATLPLPSDGHLPRGAAVNSRSPSTNWRR